MHKSVQQTNKRTKPKAKKYREKIVCTGTKYANRNLNILDYGLSYLCAPYVYVYVYVHFTLRMQALKTTNANHST